MRHTFFLSVALILITGFSFSSSHAQDQSKRIVEAPVESLVGKPSPKPVAKKTPLDAESLEKIMSLLVQRTKKDNKATKRDRDFSKSIAEFPMEDLVHNLPKVELADSRKFRVENKLENVVRRSNDTAQDNPKCEPGLIKWHESPSAAKASSLKTGKPVLLFTLLGNLDETFT